LGRREAGVNLGVGEGGEIEGLAAAALGCGGRLAEAEAERARPGKLDLLFRAPEGPEEATRRVCSGYEHIGKKYIAEYIPGMVR